MDEFNRDLIKHSYQELARRNRERPSPKELLAHMFSQWVVYRDARIEQMARRTRGRVSQARLAALYDKVDMLLYEANFWEPETAWDDEQKADDTAWGLALLRWVNWECDGRAPMVNVTEAEAAEWLAQNDAPVHRNGNQMSLFLGG